MFYRVVDLAGERWRAAGNLLIMACGLGLAGCTAQQFGGREGDAMEMPLVNPLAFVPNPYLQTFAATPIFWYPWGGEALEDARQSGKLLAIDIGTTACFPCQLQERTVYRDSGVVQFMNDQFISIRIDRIERPDLARRYLALKENGGWPLQVIALPDGRPLAVGNFLTPERWEAELRKQARFWNEAPYQAEQQANANWDLIKSRLAAPVPPSVPVTFSFEQTAQAVLQRLDLSYGGTRGVPKFPVTLPYLLLLRQQGLQPAFTWSQPVEQYLNQLASGAIYDHLGGGICRCAEDATWREPCFEKTLYDNAMLLRLLAARHKLAPSQQGIDMMYQVRSFLEKDLRIEGALYAAALRPDSEGELGRYYLWPEIELRAALKEQADPFLQTYNVTRSGNWGRGQNVLFRTLSDESLAAGYGLNVAEWQSRLHEWEATVLAARDKRLRPARDLQQIAGWNALLASAAVECFLATGDKSWLALALRVGDHLESLLLRPDGSLYRALIEGIPEGSAFLSDYAYTLEAFLLLYQVTLEPSWLEQSHNMVRYLLAYHYQPEDGWFVATGPQQRDWLRQYDLEDDILPSGQAVLMQELLKISWLLDKPSYRDIVRRSFLPMKERIFSAPGKSVSWAMLGADLERPAVVIAIQGDEAKRWHSTSIQVVPDQVLFVRNEGTRDPSQVTIRVGLQPLRAFGSVGEADSYLQGLFPRP